MWRRLLVLALVTCGGSKDTSQAGSFTSGSRLRAEVHEVDGVRALHAWFDKTRNEECAFDRHGMADGKHYCLPTSSVDVQAWSDAACTQPVYIQFNGEPLPKYVVEEPADACAAQPALHSIGAPTGSTDIFVQGAGCMASTTQGTVYATTPVSIDSFASATEHVEARSGRMGALVLESSDGAREVVSAWDQQRNEASYVATWQGSGELWLPARFAWIGGSLTRYFEDGACTKQVGTLYGARFAACPITAILDERSGAPLSNAGAAVDASKIFTIAQDGTCGPYAPSPSIGVFRFVEIGAPFPVSDLAPATHVRSGSGRVKLTLDGTPAQGGVAPPAGNLSDGTAPMPALYDSKLGAPCSVAKMEDGTLRCLPSDSFVDATRIYSDAACTQLAIGTTVQPAPAYAAVAITSDTYAIYPVGAPLKQAYCLKANACSACMTEGHLAAGPEASASFEIVTMTVE